jgi:hypothetical protein
MRKAGNSEPIDAKLDAPNQFGGCAGASLEIQSNIPSRSRAADS